MRFVTTLLLLLSAFPLCSQVAPAVRRITAVQNVSLTGDSIISSDGLQHVVSDIQHTRYSRNIESSIADVARNAMGNEGYFKAEVETVATQVLDETTRTRTIAVTLRIREGEQFHVSHITFVHNKTFSEAQLRQEFLISDGDVMSDKKIREGLENTRKLYTTKGYIEGGAVPQVVADDANRTLSITMDVNEGPQYTINGLTLEEGSQYSVNGVVPKTTGRWSAAQATRLQTLAGSYIGTHEVQGFIDAVKKQLAEMFPDYTQIDSLIGTTQGTTKCILTVNVHYPEEIPL